MTLLDWLILAGTIVFAISGYLRGFIVAALSLVGFVAGAVAGTRIAEALLSGGSSSRYAPVVGLLAALVVGVLLASGLEGIDIPPDVRFTGVLKGENLAAAYREAAKI